MFRRQHARVRLRLPVRLRWVAPLGQQCEVCETKNVSRGGLLLTCKAHHDVGLPLWVTFPFDPAMPEAQPESLARVVRNHQITAGTAVGEEIALRFEGVPRAAATPRDPIPQTTVMNAIMRTAAVPIRVRPRHIPWHEEAMTIEVSAEKMRFVSNREYEPGEILLVTFVNADAKPWQGSGEIIATIENVEKMPQSSSLIVTLKRAA